MDDERDDELAERIGFNPKHLFDRAPVNNDAEKHEAAMNAYAEKQRTALGEAHFLDPLSHSDRPRIFTGLRGRMVIDAVIFDGENTEHHAIEEPDKSLVMHSIKFRDGSNVYMEVRPNGTFLHFNTDALVELSQGVLVVGPRSAKNSLD